MNNVSKLKSKGKKQKTLTLQQKIDAAQKQQAKRRAQAELEPITVSPARTLTRGYAIAGLLLRTLVLFTGIFGLNLFFCDAVQIVILNKAKPENLVLSAGFLLLWSLLVTLVTMALSLHKISRLLSPLVVGGAAVLYLFTAYADPLDYIAEAFRRLYNLLIENMAHVGYTTYMQYITEEPFEYPEQELLAFAVASLVVVSGCWLALSSARRVHAPGVVVLCAVYMIPVFMFNITRSNLGLGCLLTFLCGIVALYLHDGLYGGVFAARRAAKDAKKEKKRLKKQAKKDARQAKRSLKNAAVAAYNAAITAGQPRAAAKKAKAAVFAQAKKERDDRVKAEKQRIQAEKIARTEAKQAARQAKKEAQLAAKEERKRQRVRAVQVKKANRPDEQAAFRQEQSEAREARRAARRARCAGDTERLRVQASGGFAGTMAMLIAVLALWMPLLFVQKNFPIIDTINKPMQLARTYVTAYLMGDDVDLNSLAMYGGVAELNPRTVNFVTPRYTGQKLFSVEVGYQAPVYMRSWIGSRYDLETDHWSSAEAEEVLAYRERFGSSYTPDNITYFFNKFVYPNALDVEKVNQYRNLDEFGFRTFQVHVTRTSGTSRILFVPSVHNAGMGILERGSIERTPKKYSAYYDGIYSSRFFGENTSYSVSSFNPVMKHPELGVNLEGSIRYYNLADTYARTIDTIEQEIEDNILFKEDKEYTYETPLGDITMTGTDLSFLADRFEEDIASFGYKYKAESFVNMYLAMTKGERKQFHRAFDSELNYRDYAEETYTAPFGSPDIHALALQILDEAGIVMGEKPVHDKSYLEEKSDVQIKRMSAEERYGNLYETWFTSKATGEPVPRHDVIRAVVEYLRNNYTYTLDPNCPQTELLDENGEIVRNEAGEPIMVDMITADSNLEAFLFDIKEGYCVHFATSAVALLRELGFAVRYDEGYIAAGYVRTYDPEAADKYRTSVRDYDAHAWVEVYYPAMGWMAYECTPTYCPDIYDLNAPSSSGSSGGINTDKVTVHDTPDLPDDEVHVDFGTTEEEVDYTALFVALGVTLGVVLVVLLVWMLLRKRAMRAVQKRQKLIAGARDEKRYQAGETDIHAEARALTDCIFELFAGLGCPPETGELPTDYAGRIDGDYADISKYKTSAIMAIIEKEEFGGKLTFRELASLGEYLEEIQSSVYAALPAGQKMRMRYLMNVI